MKAALIREIGGLPELAEADAPIRDSSRALVEIHAVSLNPIDIDLRAAGATIAFALLAVLIAGVLPALIGTGQRTTESLRLTSRSATPGRRARTVTSVMLARCVAWPTSG